MIVQAHDGRRQRLDPHAPAGDVASDVRGHRRRRISRSRGWRPPRSRTGWPSGWRCAGRWPRCATPGGSPRRDMVENDATPVIEVDPGPSPCASTACSWRRTRCRCSRWPSATSCSERSRSTCAAPPRRRPVPRRRVRALGRAGGGGGRRLGVRRSRRCGDFVAGRLVTVGLVDAWVAAAACRVAPDPEPLRSLEIEALAHVAAPALRAAAGRPGPGAAGHGRRSLARRRLPARRRTTPSCSVRLRPPPASRRPQRRGRPSTPASWGRARPRPSCWAIDTVDALAVAVALAPLAASVVADGRRPRRPVPSGRRRGWSCGPTSTPAEVRLFAS